MRKLFLLLMLCCFGGAGFSQLTASVMKIQNNTSCAKYVRVKESANPCGTFSFQTVIVQPYTTISVNTIGTGTSYFDAAQVADYSGSPSAPVMPGCYNVKVQGAWSTCPIIYSPSASGLSCCTGAPITTKMVKLYPSTNHAYIIID